MSFRNPTFVRFIVGRASRLAIERLTPAGETPALHSEVQKQAAFGITLGMLPNYFRRQHKRPFRRRVSSQSILKAALCPGNLPPCNAQRRAWFLQARIQAGLIGWSFLRFSGRGRSGSGGLPPPETLPTGSEMFPMENQVGLTKGWESSMKRLFSKRRMWRKVACTVWP
jgi:hypothetical protein